MLTLSPFLVLILFSTAILVFGIVYPKWSRFWFLSIFFIGLIVTTFLSIQLWDKHATVLTGLFITDNLALTFYGIFILSAALIVLIFNDYQFSQINYSKFLSFVLYVLAALLLMVSSTNLLIIFVGFVSTLYFLYAMSYGNPKQFKLLEPSHKVVWVGILSSALFLLGIIFLSFIFGTLNLGQINLAGNRVATVAIVMLVVALCVKSVLFPFHFWLPDVYQNLPVPVSALFSTSLRTACLAVLLRFTVLFPQSFASDWIIILEIIAIATMFAGNLLALIQKNLLKLLAYSAIAQGGYLLIGLTSQNKMGTSCVIFYLLVYTVMNIGVLGIVALIDWDDKKKYTEIDEIKALAYKKPMAAVFLTIFIFSLAGLPPVAGFVGKFYLFASAIKAGKLYIVIVAVINAAIAIFYYINIIATMFTKCDEIPKSPWKLKNIPLIGFMLCIILLIGFGLFPSYFMSIFERII